MNDDILTIRCADGTPIKIPLNSTGIKSVDINGEIIWVKPDENQELLAINQWIHILRNSRNCMSY